MSSPLSYYTLDEVIDKIVLGSEVKTVLDETWTLPTRWYEVAEDNPNYSSQNGVLFNKDKTELIRFPMFYSQTEYTIPASVIQIGAYAFHCCFSLEKLTLPDNLQTIDQIGLMCTAITDLVLPQSLKELAPGAIVNNLMLDGIVEVRSKNMVFGEYALGSEFLFKNVPKDKIYKLLCLKAQDPIPDELQQYIGAPETESVLLRVYPEYIERATDDLLLAATIRCHAGSTAEAYAIEHGMDYELTHFFEGDWNYDWDNLIRWRKCIHCDARETEPLETETPGGAEIVGPADGDTSFDVEPVSTDYVLIKEALGEQNVVKAFDISLKNSDGIHVQPKGTVKVKLPGDFKTGDYKVYRVNADGTYTDMQAFREGSHLVFYTDHFSLYVVVDESAETEPSTPDTTDTPDAPAKESKVRNILHLIFAFLQKLIRLLTQN